MAKPTLSVSPHLLLVLAQLAWAGNAIAGRIAVGVVPPISLAFWRWLVAVLLLVPFALPAVIAERHQIIRQWKLLFVLGVTSVTSYNTLLYLALTTSTAINTTLVTSTMPVAIVALSWLWLGIRLRRLQVLGVALSLAGVVLVIARGEWRLLASLTLEPGDVWALAAMATWSVFSVLLRRYPPGLSAKALLFVQVLLGLVALVPIYLVELASVGGFEPSSRAILLILFVAIFPSLFAYGFWNIGVGKLGPQLSGLYINLTPVFTAIMGAALLGEPVAWFHALGLGLIISGIVAVTKG